MKGLYQACGLSIAPLAEIFQALDLPNWALRICEQLRRTIFKRLMDLNPTSKLDNPRDLGRLIGICQRQLAFLIDTRSETKRMAQTTTGEMENFAVAVATQDEPLLLVQEAVKEIVTDGLMKSPTEQNDFFAGFAEGQELFLDARNQFVGDKGRTTVYFALLARWSEIEEMRNTHQPKTCSDLYELIAPSLNDPRKERFEWFTDVCDGIGLFVKRRGRPPKNKGK